MTAEMEGIIRRVASIFSGIAGFTVTAAAHAGEESSTTGHHMMEGCLSTAWCDGAAHMMGYGILGAGGWGIIFGAAAWLLIILGFIYILQEMLEDKE